MRRRGRKSSMTVEERKERNRQYMRAYMRAYWERKKKGVKQRAYVKRKAAQA